MWQGIKNSTKSIKKDTKTFLFFGMQGIVAREKHDWILEGEKDSVFPQTQQRHRWEEESKLERWKKGGQGWLRVDFKERTSLCRLPWIRERTSSCDGGKFKEMFKTKGGCTPRRR